MEDFGILWIWGFCGDSHRFFCGYGMGMGIKIQSPRQPCWSDIPYDLVTSTFNFGGRGACRRCGSTSSIRISILKFLGLTVRKIWHILCVFVSRPVTLKLVRNVARVMGYFPVNFGDITIIGFRFMSHWATRLRLIT